MCRGRFGKFILIFLSFPPPSLPSLPSPLPVFHNHTQLHHSHHHYHYYFQRIKPSSGALGSVPRAVFHHPSSVWVWEQGKDSRSPKALIPTLPMSSPIPWKCLFPPWAWRLLIFGSFSLPALSLLVLSPNFLFVRKQGEATRERGCIQGTIPAEPPKTNLSGRKVWGMCGEWKGHGIHSHYSFLFGEKTKFSIPPPPHSHLLPSRFPCLIPPPPPPH